MPLDEDVKVARENIMLDPGKYMRLAGEQYDRDRLWEAAPWWRRFWYWLTWD